MPLKSEYSRREYANNNTLTPLPPRLQYIAYKARATPLPWDPTFGDIDDAKRRELYSEISGKTGLSLEALGYSEKK